MVQKSQAMQLCSEAEGRKLEKVHLQNQTNALFFFIRVWLQRYNGTL